METMFVAPPKYRFMYSTSLAPLKMARLVCSMPEEVALVLRGRAYGDFLGRDDHAEGVVHGHPQEGDDGGDHREGIGGEGPVRETALLGSDDGGDVQGPVLDGDRYHGQGEGHLEGRHLGQAAAHADGAVGVAALAGAQGHAQLAEEDEVHHQEEVAGVREIAEQHGAEDRRDEHVGADAAGKPEHGSKVEHDAVAYRVPLGGALDDVDVGLPHRLADPSLDLGAYPRHGPDEEETVVRDHEQGHEGIAYAGEDIGFHQRTPRAR